MTTAAKITYDGESVEFHGPVPQNLEGLIDIMQRNAAANGRVVTSVKVDGVEVLHAGTKAPATYTKIDFATASDQELFVQAIDSTLVHTPQPDAALDPILESLLTDSWSSAFTKLNNFLQSLAPYFELLANLSAYGKNTPAVRWGAQLEPQLKTLEEVFKKILSTSEGQQVAELTSLLNFELRPLYTDSLDLVKNTIRPTFQK